MAEAFGVDAARLKIVVFVYAALLACVSGWLYAHLQRFVNPTPFGINQGIEYLFMAVVGGAGSVWGAVLGATLITLLKQVLQDSLPHLLGRDGNFEVVVFGILMIAAAAARARRRLAVAGATAAREPRAGRCRRAAACRARARASARGAAAGRRQRAQGVRRPGRGQRSVVRDSRRRDPRPDRAQRRRQEHDVQPDQRRAAADPRRRSVRRPAASAACSRSRSRAAASAARSSTSS